MAAAVGSEGTVKVHLAPSRQRRLSLLATALPLSQAQGARLLHLVQVLRQQLRSRAHQPYSLEAIVRMAGSAVLSVMEEVVARVAMLVGRYVPQLSPVLSRVLCRKSMLGLAW